MPSKKTRHQGKRTAARRQGERRIAMWGARSGEARTGDRRSGFSEMQREVDKQYQDQ